MHQEYEEQKGWLSRLERERRNLSASVEEALVDPRAQTHLDGGETYGQTGMFETASGTPLVPPRLSLQSRVMSTVQPGSFVKSATSAYRIAQGQGMQAGVVDSQKLRQVAVFAQTFTSRLAYYGYDPAQAATNPLLAVPGVSRVSSPMRAHSSEGWSVLNSYNSVPAPFPSMVLSSRLSSAQSTMRQRLGGRSTRIRLEVPSEEQMAARFAASHPTNSRQEAIRDYQREVPSGSTSQQAALDIFRADPTGTTSARLPVIDMVKSQLEASRRGLCGTGFFEAGQGDSIVTNKRITASCVIQVMLTDNPGPVVVHYVSLQPRIGFTIHLTAPTQSRTPFNYIILLGE